MSTRLSLALGLVLAACGSPSRPQTPAADSGVGHPDSRTPQPPTPDARTQPAVDAPEQPAPDAGSTTPPSCGLACNPSNNAGCSGGMTCSAWKSGDTYGAACFATAGTAPEFEGAEFDTCHAGSAAAADRCPLGTYCDDGLSVCLTICDPAAGGTPLYPDSPATSWALLGSPSCTHAYGDDCKTKDYLNNYVDLCLPYCTNVL